MFSSTQQPGGGLFGSVGTGQQAGGSIFGAPATGQNQQTGSNIFGGLGQNTQQNQTQNTGLFGGLGQNNQNQQQSGGLFGGSTQQQNQPQQSTGLFGGLGQSNQQQLQQTGSLFNPQQGLAQSQQGQFNNSIWQPNSGISPRKFFQAFPRVRTNISKVRRASLTKSKPFLSNGILAAPTALSNIISTTKSLPIPKNTFDLARMKIQRNGRMH
jgi:hypothetical protein